MAQQSILRRLPHITALRPHQWTKNLIVFAAPLFAFKLTSQTLLGALLAFILFCCTSSSFYLLNDIVDIEADRQHPTKCKRPIAAGLVSIPAAFTMAIVLLGGSLLTAWSASPALGAVMLSYALLQVAYNLKLKRTPILDIIAIATGFVLRACAGGAVTEIFLSPWFLLCTAMLALFLAVEKRKAELRLSKIHGGKTRSVLRRYSLPLLHRMENIVTTSVVMSYALWSAGPVVRGASTSWMLLTLPFVLYGVFRYQLLSDVGDIPRSEDEYSESEKLTERPEDVLLKDVPIMITVASWIVTVFTILLLDQQGLI